MHRGRAFRGLCLPVCRWPLFSVALDRLAGRGPTWKGAQQDFKARNRTSWDSGRRFQPPEMQCVFVGGESSQRQKQGPGGGGESVATHPLPFGRLIQGWQPLDGIGRCPGIAADLRTPKTCSSGQNGGLGPFSGPCPPGRQSSGSPAARMFLVGGKEGAVPLVRCACWRGSGQASWRSSGGEGEAGQCQP